MAVVAAVPHRIELGEVRNRLVAQLIGYMDFQARGQNLKYGFVLALIDATRKNTLLIGIHGIDGVVVNAGLRIVKAHG